MKRAIWNTMQYQYEYSSSPPLHKPILYIYHILYIYVNVQHKTCYFLYQCLCMKTQISVQGKTLKTIQRCNNLYMYCPHILYVICPQRDFQISQHLCRCRITKNLPLLQARTKTVPLTYIKNNNTNRNIVRMS